MLILNQGFFNLLIYLTENCPEVKYDDLKSLLKQPTALYFLISITVVEPTFIGGEALSFLKPYHF
jgi:hypothetical protein